ncbi:hypothetical protein BC831DRAFT_474995 [Entophlyctis helioformis]|nr:hypothetical protein BC831DRAFT_474995 [Entophlyctis helioformis]
MWQILNLLNERQRTSSKTTIDNLELLLTTRLKSFAKYPLQQRRTFCELVEYEKHRPGKLIVMENHLANSFYFVLSGKLEIFKGWDDAKYRINVIGQGDSFGDRTMAVLNDKRTASVTTIDNVELLRVDKRDYAKYAKQVQQQITSRINQISSIPLFAKEPSMIERMLVCTQFTKFEAQQTIFKEDDTNFQLMWVLSGSCRCIKYVPFVKKRIQGSDTGFQLHAYDPDKPLEPGEELTRELLSISEMASGDNYPSLPQFKMPQDPNTLLPRFDRSHYIAALKDAPALTNNVTVVANSVMEAMIISRLEFAQIASDDMINYLLDDGSSNIPLIKLQQAYLERIKWDAYKKKVRTEIAMPAKAKAIKKK